MAGGSIIGRLKARRERAQHKRRFVRSVEVLHEGAPVAEGVTVVALVRDGMFYLDEFLAHYRKLGAVRFVFCDNGSTDGTVARAMAEPDTVMLRSALPWGEIENDFRRYAAERYCRGQWCLFADMDEIFEAGAGLDVLTRYLEANGYTALVAQMLEMFPQTPLRDAAGLSYREALAAFEWYDLREVERCGYHDEETGFSWFLQGNTVPDARIGILFGGTRRRVFGERCCLTKHPLVRLADGVEPGVHPHAAAHVACADFTALIRHYKFAGDTAARDADTVARAAIPHGEDRARLDRFAADPGLRLWTPEAQRFDGLAPLQKAGFLLRSDAFERFCKEQRR